MRCTRPLRASFDRAGNVTYSSKNALPGLVPFEIECRKCLACRLNGARDKAIRCWHETRMHPSSIFITLTYSDEHLESPRLIYSHWQTFIKDLRNHVDYKTLSTQKITCMVTGEYGDKNKRPHWHAIIFNYAPDDAKILRETDRGDIVYTSETLSNIWNKGLVEFGSVTLDSANYVARYAAKKLSHGKDQDHNYHPLHRTSSRRAIGRSWIEKNFKHTFENGFVVLPNGQQSKIPRYYVDWAKQHQPEAWLYYVTKLRPEIQKTQELKQRKEDTQWISELFSKNPGDPRPLTRPKVKETILTNKFKRLQERLKL